MSESESTQPDSINTGGGAFISGNVTVGGDLVGRDQIQGMSPEEVKKHFTPVLQEVNNRPNTKDDEINRLKAEIEQLKAEVAKGDNASESFLSERLKNIGSMAPDILEVVATTLVNPVAGFASVVKKVADKAKQ
ncbi:MAG: hypothetical protein AAGD96_00335 [Chloroflexota bacterium]